MSGSAEHVEAAQGYKLQAIIAAVVAEVLLVAAVAAWIWVDRALAIFLIVFSLVLILSAANSSKASRLSRQLGTFIGHRETVQAQLPATLAGGKRGRNKAVLVVLTELHFYLFELHIGPRPAEIRLAYANLLSVTMGGPKRPLNLLIELPDRTLDLYGLQVDHLSWFEDVLAIARPGLVSGSLADELRAAQSD